MVSQNSNLTGLGTESIGFDGREVAVTTKRYGTVTVPVTSVVDVVVRTSAALGGRFIALSVLTQNGPTAFPKSTSAAVKSPYAMRLPYGRDGFPLAGAILAAKPLEPEPLPAGAGAFATGARVASFKGDDGTRIVLYEHAVECGGMVRPVAGVKVDVESGSALKSRITATRLLLLGPFALAFKKSKGGERYLTLEGSDFAWMAKVEDKHVGRAMDFVSQVRNAAARG